MNASGNVGGCDPLHQLRIIAETVDAKGFADIRVEVDPHRVYKTTKCTSETRNSGSPQRTKQKGTAELRYPFAPPIWLPQQFTAPCRNQTGDTTTKGNARAAAIIRKQADPRSLGAEPLTRFVIGITDSRRTRAAGPRVARSWGSCDRALKEWGAPRAS